MKTFREAHEPNDFFSNRSSHSDRSERERTANFVNTLKEKIDKDPTLSIANLMNDMAIARFAIDLAIHDDLWYKSFVPKNHQLRTEKAELTGN